MRRQLADRDFAGCGYFPGIALQALPLLVYLDAPAIRFHRSTDVLLRYLTVELEIIRVAVSESWCCGICFVMRR